MRSFVHFTLAFFLTVLSLPAQDAFVVAPYVQLGDNPQLQAREQLTILWHTADRDQNWSAEFKDSSGEWVTAEARLLRTLRHPSRHRIYAATLQNLEPGAEVPYRILLDTQPVFEAQARARKSASQPYRFAVMGDIAQGTRNQRAIAHQLYEKKPDFLAIPGDIVYGSGRASEYRRKYFPVYNAAKSDPATGAPLLRSTLTIAVPGNHDVASRNLRFRPDGLAYFYYWSQPRNGPCRDRDGDPSCATPLFGSSSRIEAFLETTQGQFPQMASFSFDYGNSHWTVIDSNSYVNWGDPKLLEWLRNDLASASKATWRFVLLHHPPFSSSRHHASQQRMRYLAPIFEKGGVSIAFAGHVHNYQRSHPLTFVPNEAIFNDARVEGKWVIDTEFDGKDRTKPSGILYLVTGAGGASLYDRSQQSRPDTWEPFTKEFISTVNSFTLVDVDGSKLHLTQVDVSGKVIDEFTLTK
jgi:3',5'-cyclic AMP phosphodiesterase CpdA